MRQRYLKTFMVVVAVLLLVGMGTVAFADWGRGYGRHHMGYGPGSGPGAYGGCGYGYGPGWHHRGYGYGRGGGDLSAEELKQLEEARETFFDATRDLRSNLRQKRLELEAELTKAEPDSAKAFATQKEISDLRAQLDQKRVEHRIKMEKLFPEGGPRRGLGFEGRRGLRGGGGPGACWY
ncbi:MAG: periplasmic heavy metal sensor [Deltaproteobacteria bacterium]|nr:periplasmic heavy metal sensor [Deltaproteobacteria bacterium]